MSMFARGRPRPPSREKNRPLHYLPCGAIRAPHATVRINRETSIFQGFDMMDTPERSGEKRPNGFPEHLTKRAILLFILAGIVVGLMASLVMRFMGGQFGF